MNPFFRDLSRGIQAVVPLWLGLVPFAFAYAVTARNGGLDRLETQLMSALVMTTAAIDWVVHHALILELTGES